MQATGAQKDGPWGGPEGTPFDIDDKNHPPKCLENILIWSTSDHISAIKFTYKDDSDVEFIEGPFGVADHPPDTITIVSGEYVKDLSGTYDAVRVTSLTVTTTKTAYGPYGKQDGTPFSSKKGDIVAFFGRSSNDNGLNAIGTYYIPPC